MQVEQSVKDKEMPTVVILHGIDRNSSNFSITLLKLREKLCSVAKLGRAHRGVIARMGEQNQPGTLVVLVEVERAGGGLSIKIGGGVTQT